MDIVVGNSLGRAPLGGRETEAWTRWTDRKPREIAWGELHWEGATTPNFIKIRLFRKTARPRLVKVPNPGHGTCIGSLAGCETKRAGLLAKIFQDKFYQRERLLKRFLNAGHRDMHGKKFFAGAVFILHGVLSVDARLSLPSQRSKLNENPSIGYASAWEEGVALKMRGCWHGFCTEEL